MRLLKLCNIFQHLKLENVSNNQDLYMKIILISHKVMTDLSIAESKIIDVVEAMSTTPGRHDDWIAKLVHAKTLIEGARLTEVRSGADCMDLLAGARQDLTYSREEIQTLRAARNDLVAAEIEARQEIARLRSSEMNFAHENFTQNGQLTELRSALEEAQRARIVCDERLLTLSGTILANQSKVERRREIADMRGEDINALGFPLTEQIVINILFVFDRIDSVINMKMHRFSDSVSDSVSDGKLHMFDYLLLVDEPFVRFWIQFNVLADAISYPVASVRSDLKRTNIEVLTMVVEAEASLTTRSTKSKFEELVRAIAPEKPIELLSGILSYLNSLTDLDNTTTMTEILHGWFESEENFKEALLWTIKHGQHLLEAIRARRTTH